MSAFSARTVWTSQIVRFIQPPTKIGCGRAAPHWRFILTNLT